MLALLAETRPGHFWFATAARVLATSIMFMNVFSQCEYLKAIIMYALNSHQKEGGPYENDSIIFMGTELFFSSAAGLGWL